MEGIKTVRYDGKYLVYQRMTDNKFNATSLLKQWNSENLDNKSMDEFLKDKESFENYFSGFTFEVESTVIKGDTWVDEHTFRSLLCYLNPKLFFVDYHKYSLK